MTRRSQLDKTRLGEYPRKERTSRKDGVARTEGVKLRVEEDEGRGKAQTM